MSRAIRSFLVLFSLSFAMPFPAIGQTYYKCKTPSGGTIFSDAPCASGTRQEQVAPGPSPDRQYAAPEAPTSQRSSDTRALDAKVAEALGTGDLPRAKRLAVTPEQWRMIAEAEQRYRQPVTGRTGADLRAESKNSQECKDAQWSYDVEASSIRKDAAQINAAKRRMYSACGMNEPNVTDNRTVIIDNRSVAPAPAPRSMRCQQRGNGQMDCW